MSDQPKLLIDVGNTQLKYAWFSAADDIALVQSQTTELGSLPELLKSKPEVLICSVKSAAVTSNIVAELQRFGLKYRVAETKRSEYGITNSYEQISNMGSDRWMAMMGADALVSHDTLIVDAGTAITCDFVVNKQHLGGWIAPGLSMLRATVVKNTQRVFDFSELTAQLEPGKDTANCVANGALAQLVGMIMQANTIMQSHTQQYSVILTGGDREILSAQLQPNIDRLLVHNNLVIAGLARLSLM